MELKQTTHYNYFVIFSLPCSCYYADMIKKLELHLLVGVILFKVEFGHCQISVPKISKLMSKIAYINPYPFRQLLPLSCFYGSSQWLFKVKITFKRASFIQK